MYTAWDPWMLADNGRGWLLRHHCHLFLSSLKNTAPFRSCPWMDGDFAIHPRPQWSRMDSMVDLTGYTLFAAIYHWLWSPSEAGLNAMRITLFYTTHLSEHWVVSEALIFNMSSAMGGHHTTLSSWLLSYTYRYYSILALIWCICQSDIRWKLIVI